MPEPPISESRRGLANSIGLFLIKFLNCSTSLCSLAGALSMTKLFNSRIFVSCLSKSCYKSCKLILSKGSKEQRLRIVALNTSEYIVFCLSSVIAY